MKAHITFEVEVSDIAGLLSRLGMADAPVTIEHGNSDTATRTRRSRTTQTEANDAPAQEAPAAEAPRRRRASAEAPAVPASDEAPPAETSGRRRRSSAAPVEAAPTISDIDLGKAASEAAESLTKLGDAGHQIVQDVLKEDFGVEMVNDLPADKRQAFLDELLNQVALAKADAAKQ